MKRKLKGAVNKLQEELIQQKTIAETISEENVKIKKEFERLQPLIDFVVSFDAPENLKTILNYLKDDYLDDASKGKLRPLKVEFSPYISQQIKEIAQKSSFESFTIQEGASRKKGESTVFFQII